MDLVLEGTFGLRQVQQLDDSHDRDGTDGQVDKEGPSPGSMVGKYATEKGSNDRRETEHGSDDALVLATVTKRDKIRDDDHDRRHDASSTHTGDSTSDNDPGHALSCTAECRSNEEDTDSKEKCCLATKNIRELSVPNRSGWIEEERWDC